MNIFKKCSVFIGAIGFFVLPFGLYASASMLMPPDYGSETAPGGRYFKDVTDNHPFVESINELKQKSLVKGYADSTFAPDKSISRAEFLTMVMASTTKNPQGSNCFKDVKDEWFAKFVCTAKQRGLVKGYADGTFKPANNINLAEASLILAKAYRLRSTPAKSGVWYKPFVEKLAQKGAIPTSIDYPDKKLARAEVAEMIWRLKTKTTDKPTKTYQALQEPLPAISSCAELEEKLRLQIYQQSKYRSMPIMLEAVPAVAAGAKSESRSYSTTNVQVAGVDEADIIKNDADYIYMVSNKIVRILKAFPPEEMTEVSYFKAQDENFTPSEIYISGDTLVIVGSTHEPTSYQQKTAVYVVNVSNKSHPLEVRHVEIDGNALSSRRINDKVFLVTNYRPNYYDALQSQEGVTAKLLPSFVDTRSGVTPHRVDCSEVRFVPDYNEMNFMSILTIDLDDADDSDGARAVQAIAKPDVIMGSGETIYASLDNLYIVATRSNYPTIGIFDVWSPPSFEWQKTVIYQFNLKNAVAEFKGSGEVKGSVLNQFSMDEYGDAFRIATTTGNVTSRGDPSKNHLFILNKNNLGEVLGKIENIAPGERIYSARFMGDRAYLVTFKKVDPFFVIDVSNPRLPQILGELKIPGYSDYLHPFDENHVIGFGKEAVDPEELPHDAFRDFDFAWYQGMKIALFDVTDVKNPKALFKETIGDRGTNSELLSDHKALLFDKSSNLFALPVELHVIKDKTEGKYTGSKYGDPVFQGAYIYTLDLENGFKLKGTITHYDDPTVFQKSDYWQYGDVNAIRRILYIGDYFYTVSGGRLKAIEREDMREAGMINLAGGGGVNQPDPGF